MSTKKETYVTQNEHRKITIKVFETANQVLFDITCNVPGYIKDGPDLDGIIELAISPFEADKRRLVMACNGMSAVVRNIDETTALVGIGPSKGKVPPNTPQDDGNTEVTE